MMWKAAQLGAMRDNSGRWADSPDDGAGLRREGGLIPEALGDAAAFYLCAASPSPIPVLIAVPHAGRAYPPALLAQMRKPELAALRLEDRLVDQLGVAVARATGASLLVAQAPRAMIDLNRAEADIDWDMLGLPAPEVEQRHAAQGNMRARSGLGLVPRRLPGMGEIWRGRLAQEALLARIAGVHQPYHAALAGELAALRARWGAALLIDLHSMPPLPRQAGRAAAQIVLGDRFGASCHGGLVASAFAHCAAHGFLAAHNRPYAGGYALDRHGDPRGGVHGFQLEIDRAAYLDERLIEPGEGFAGVVAMLDGLVRKLADEVGRLGAGQREGWAEAAE